MLLLEVDDDMILLLWDMFIPVDMFCCLDVLVLPLPLLDALLPFDREVEEELGSRAFLRWQSTQYNKNFEIASLGMNAYKSATLNINKPVKSI